MTVVDNDTESQLLVYVIFGSGDYACVKCEAKPQVGKHRGFNDAALNDHGVVYNQAQRATYTWKGRPVN